MPKKSLIEQVAEEREVRLKEDERRNALEEKMELWKKQGFTITPLMKIIKNGIDAAEKEFELYEGALKKLDELNRQFKALDVKEFKYESQSILTKLKDPRTITGLEKDIKKLKEKIDLKRIEEGKKRMKLAEIEAKKFAEERRKLELEAKHKADQVKALELEKQKKEGEKKRLIAEAKKLKEEQKKAKIEAKKAEQDRKKMKLEAKKKEEERKKLELELQHKKEEEQRQLDYMMKQTAEKRRIAEMEAKKFAEERRKVELQVHHIVKQLNRLELETKRKEEESKKLELEVKKREEERRKLELEAQKREEEQRKLMEKKKKEEEKMAKLGQEAMQRWEKEMVLKATNYITSVDEIMRTYNPEYSPLGYFLKDDEWKIEFNFEKLDIIGTVSEGFMREPMKIICVYNKEFGQKFISDVKKVLVEDVNRASRSKQFLGKCYVLDKIDDKTVISTIEKFKHPNCSIYIHSLKDNRLIYNENDMKTELFSEWFKVGGNPKSMSEILHDLADKNNEFSGKDLREKLNFNKKEMKKLIESGIENNEVYRLVGVEDRYGLYKK